ncbi:MAG: YkgJ family cysteine cluster protein [Planctomycetes bacterium]|nr:YkgJ family cysteine cluster protein [Planctomycetota bacterium]MCB9890995.1 YkgJ family cysteine cluster protein [Planctomycetota bacterium]MCB9919152.1 YkgJ family cysteine cluster protein [Planctomycetota bacterium]
MNETSVAADLSVCARCATMQRTCCQRAEILVTEGDIERIAAHTGRNDFWERRVPLDPAYLEPDDDDPNWQRYTTASDGTRRLLERRVDGDCTFLGARGCELELDVRPLVCRIYPYSYTEQGLDGLDDEYCPRAALSPDDRPMSELLEIPESVAETWRARLYEELRHGDA